MFYFIFKKNTLFVCFCLFFHWSFAQWDKQYLATQASFRAIRAVSLQVVWASGSGGTVIKTLDGGKSWSIMKVNGAETLDFRDIVAFDANHALVMSSGLGEEGGAKVFGTKDGGFTWNLLLNVQEKGVFFDSMDFWNTSEGIILGDPIDTKPYLLKTSDGGLSWDRIEKSVLPDINKGEASFAASGSCIALLPQNAIWFNTQNRIFSSFNGGKSWNVYDTPFVKGETSGIFGIYFQDRKNGVAVGGDYKNDKGIYSNIALTKDGGKTWNFIEEAIPNGLKEGVFVIHNKILMVGTSGTSIFDLKDKNWKNLDTESFHAISCKDDNCWAIGAKGNLAKWIIK